MIVIDRFGEVRDWGWVQAEYGNVQMSPLEGAGYRVVQLVEIEGPMAFTCTVLNANGNPVVGQRVAYAWPDDEQIHVTAANGVAEHIAGGGEAYDPQNATGPVSWEVRDAPSQRISGLGWLAGTNHRHLQVTMQWTDEGEPPPPAGGVEEAIRDGFAALVAVLRELFGEEPPEPEPGEVAGAILELARQVGRIADR